MDCWSKNIAIEKVRTASKRELEQNRRTTKDSRSQSQYQYYNQILLLVAYAYVTYRVYVVEIKYLYLVFSFDARTSIDDAMHREC